ncbi:type II toxin-antitoxin system PemK/MazF family toxin [Nocardia sp. CA2R105]|uniref:type II toxin-antitoxin system PemK/MazF family toxin n=1 Tax=Nocardia coffeae TaxID=2873381 RepID=UPI001CA69B70|nr:type II toxin-antitoxin system PemK/MazF family toxin [Nocardia coffeae]MBY8855568.1 type II toxin-antitoxin system PemK/MazF family toxin [Nocardia coffeae]
MRPIHIARLDKTRPVLVLTREAVRPYLARVTVAPITSTIRGLSTEVRVGPRNGLEHDSVVSCDNIVTVPADALGRLIGYLNADAEPALTAAIRSAFELI